MLPEVIRYAVDWPFGPIPAGRRLRFSGPGLSVLSRAGTGPQDAEYDGNEARGYPPRANNRESGMVDDSSGSRLYSAAMARGEPHIILTLDTKEPVELGHFVGAFTSLGNEYERFIKQAAPDLAGEPTMFVREVRAGSIVADLMPWLAIAAPFIDGMDKVLIVEQFVRTWGVRFQSLLTPSPALSTRSEFKDFTDAVAAVASDPNGSAKIEAATFEDGKREIRAAFKFTTREAREAQVAIQAHILRLDAPISADKQRVLMRFTRSDIGDASTGKPSGERVIVEELSDRSLALIYASDLAEQRIKHEIREADENVYKKGFVVDLNVRMGASGKPAAYAVTHVHQVIELAD